jgi:hypothetical protein
MRPLLLIPKLLAVCAYFGGVCATAAVWFSPWVALDLVDRVAIVRQLFVGLVVPALVVSLLMGGCLLLQHPWQFVRMRWLQVKLAVVAIGVPFAHIYMAGRLQAVRAGVDPAAHGQFSTGLILLLAGSAAVIVVSRVKPRFGQNWARVYPSTVTREPDAG